MGENPMEINLTGNRPEEEVQGAAVEKPEVDEREADDELPDYQVIKIGCCG